MRLWLRQRVVADPGIPLKGTMHGLTRWWTHSLWAPALGQQLKRCQKDTERKWVFWLQNEGWRGNFLPEPFYLPVFILNRMPYLSLHQSNNFHSPKWFPETLPHPNFGPNQATPVAFPHKLPILAHAMDFLKISQSFTNPKQEHLALVCPILLAEQPQARHWWLLALIQGLAPCRHLQAQHRQPFTDCFVAYFRWPQAGHCLWLNLPCRKAPPKRRMKWEHDPAASMNDTWQTGQAPRALLK